MDAIKRATIRIEKAQNGKWLLTPVSGDIRILDELYGKAYDELPESEKEFEAEHFEDAVKNVTEVAEALKLKVEQIQEQEVCLSFEIIPPPLEYHVDLKWSLWEDADSSIWEEYSEDEDLLPNMAAAFRGEGPAVVVYSAPRKEIRYGTVTISKGEASCQLVSLWDSPPCHIPEDCPEEFRDEFEESIDLFFSEGEGYWEDYEDPIGAKVEQLVKAETFPELMKGIGNLESALYEQEDLSSKDFQTMISEVADFLYRKKKEEQ